MKENDQLIISLLREDSRMTLTKMSKKTNIPISTLYERIKNYKDKVIKKHTSIVDFNSLGYSARARVLFKIKKNEREALKSFLSNSNYLNELHKINNGFDFMAEFIFKNMQELEEYLDQVGEKFPIEDQQTYYLLDNIKEENFLSKPHLLAVSSLKF
ncbi:MAG: Lrp/AsnC family transcriptional regulator [Nanoarchaeota archaeon]|nr:Lrp/AsnC family transcriptional regulator [Nanoarchaeota archaeon]